MLSTRIFLCSCRFRWCTPPQPLFDEVASSRRPRCVSGCSRRSVFTASDQKYTYEVRKATINRQRILCEPCWKESNHISVELAHLNRTWKGPGH
jgi:hypothetical protein